MIRKYFYVPDNYIDKGGEGRSFSKTLKNIHRPINRAVK
jgi:hypothetical protein